MLSVFSHTYPLCLMLLASRGLGTRRSAAATAREAVRAAEGAAVEATLGEAAGEAVGASVGAAAGEAVGAGERWGAR